MSPPSSDDLLIARLMDLPATERPAFWQRMCAEHPGLRDRSPEVSRLLAGTGSAAPLPAASLPLSAAVMVNALESALDPGDREAVGTPIGPYKLLQKIGEGGFGTVWMADQQEPLRRRVALKIIKVGMDTEEVIARFEIERQALALMDHPNIARVFDAGATASGRPYFVMELVRGVPITHYCDENRLTAAARLNLFVTVCSAVQHAHQKGVIHRDLKPSNILVTLHDGTPVPKIIDFGIAKATGKQLTEKTLVTQFHSFVGTPVYTSPEQMEMSGLDVDTRSDIYSLGVLLYELLAGRPPFDAATLVKSGLEAMRRTIREVDPPRPSNRLNTLSDADRTSVAHQRGTDATKLTLLLRGDVDWIVMRCLEKDRTRRYDTAAALAADIQCHLQHQPVVARPPSQSYRIGKFVRRHRVGVVASTALALSLLGGLIASSTLFVRERTAHQRAVVAEHSENRLRQQAETARTVEAKRASRTSQALAEQLLQENRTSEGLAQLVRAARSDPENYVIGPRLIAALAYRSFALPVGESIAGVRYAGYSKDGQRLFTYGDDGVIRYWELPSGKAVQSFTLAWPSASGESADGRRCAFGQPDGTVTVWEPAIGKMVLGPLRHGGRIVAVAFTPDGRWLGTASTDRTAKIWDAATGELRATLQHATPVGEITFSADSRRVVTTAGSGRWRVWAVPEGAPLTPVRTVRTQANRGLFSPDGAWLVVTDGRGAQVFDAREGYTVARTLEHDGPCYFAEFAADGRQLATTSDDATARIWDMPSGKPAFPPLAHGGLVKEVHFIADGRHLITRSFDGLARVWDLRSGQLAQEPVGAGQVLGISVARDGSEFLTHFRDHSIRRWRVAPGAVRPLRLPADPDRLRIHVESDTDDTAWGLFRRSLQKIDLLTGRKFGEARALPVTVYGGVLARRAAYACVNVGSIGWELWDLRGREIVRHPLGRYAGLRSFVFSADSSRLAAIDDPRRVRVWDTGSGALTAGPIEGAGRFYDFSPDGRQLVVAMLDGTAALWDATTGSPVGEPLRHEGGIQRVQFSPDGGMIASGSQDGIAQVWNSRTRKPVGPPLVHRSMVRGAVFARDNKRLLTWTPLDTRLWDVATGAQLTEPMIGGNDVNLAVFNEDESRIATWARTGDELRIWDTASGQMLVSQIGGVERLGDTVGSPAFSATGKFLTVPTLDGLFYVWPMPPSARQQAVPDWLLRLATVLAGGEIDANAAFCERAVEVKAFDEIRRELAALPAEAPFAEWGRWFLADRATRPIGPGLKITAAEAEPIEAERRASEMAGKELQALIKTDGELRQAGKFAEAAAVERQLLVLLERRFGRESEEFGRMLPSLVTTLIQAGQAPEAEPVARDYLALCEKFCAADSLEIPAARFLVGWSLLAQKRQAEAEPLLLAGFEGVKGFEALMGLSADQHKAVVQAVEQLARLYEAMQQPAKAAEWREQAKLMPARPAPTSKP